MSKYLDIYAVVWFCTLVLCIYCRDHPDTIKRRFISVAFICIIVIPILWCFGNVSNNKNVSIFVALKLN